MAQSTLDIAFQALTSGDDGRVCRDIPDEACHHQPQNFFKHSISLALTKAADGFVDPKLVLSWLLVQLGASSGIIGLLVPIREAGALLPQIVTAAPLRALPLRKYAWAIASLVQGGCAGAMALTAMTLSGQSAGLIIVTLLLILALARSVCSVTYKDVLGKTVDKSRRGAATGLASSISALVVFAFGALLALDGLDKKALVLAGLLAGAGCWAISAALFMTLTERPGATGGGGKALTVVQENWSVLTQDRQFQWFIVARGLLTATALAPPFMVALGGQGDSSGPGQLGLLVIASSAATFFSGYIWGRLADRSSRKVLMVSALVAGGFLGATVALYWSGLLGHAFVLPILLFGVMIAYQGVRLGRSTHLIDMAGESDRTIYTALSNTVIGVLLLLGSLFSVIANVYGTDIVLGMLAAMSGLAVFAAYQLDEVQA